MHKILVLFILLSVLFAVPVYAAVSFDAVMTGGNGTTGNSQQCDDQTSCSSTGMTVGSSASCLVAFLVFQNAPSSTPVVTWNGTAMTAGPTVTSGNDNARIYVLPNPAIGNRTLAATWTGTADLYLSSASFIGTDTTTCINTSHNVTATNTTSISVTTSSDGATVALFGVNGATPTMTGCSGCVALFGNQALAPGGGASYVLSGTSTNSHTFTGANGSTQALVGVHILTGGPPDLNPPTDPIGLLVTARSSTSFSLAWTGSTDDVASSIIYRIESAATCGGTFTQIDSIIATTTYVSTGYTSSTAKCFRVRANDGVNNSGYTNTASSTTLAGRTVNLSWTDNSNDEDSFQVEVCEFIIGSCVPSTILSQPTAHILTDSDSPQPGACYRVKALKSGTVGSAYTNTYCTTLAPPANTHGNKIKGWRP